jgi:hypothetical protein
MSIACALRIIFHAESHSFDVQENADALFSFGQEDADAGVQRLQVHAAAKESWRGSVERMQQTVMESAVSAMNGMLSSLERTRTTSLPEQQTDNPEIYSPNAPLDKATKTVRLNIKAKASVLRPVRVR